MHEREEQKTSIDRIIDQILINPRFDISANNIKAEHYIDMGYDSIVINFMGMVYKFYGKGYGPQKFDRQQLNLYKHITNEAKTVVDSKRYQSTDLVTKKNYRLKINPFLETFTSDFRGVFVGMMPLVVGPRLGEVFADPICDALLKKFSNKLCNDLGVVGIDLTGFNTKLVNGSFVVTDLCTRIPFLSLNEDRIIQLEK